MYTDVERKRDTFNSDPDERKQTNEKSTHTHIHFDISYSTYTLDRAHKSISYAQKTLVASTMKIAVRIESNLAKANTINIHMAKHQRNIDISMCECVHNPH